MLCSFASLVFGAANQGFDFDFTPNEFSQMAAPSSIEAACRKFAASLTTMIEASGLPAEKVIPLLNSPATTPASAVPTTTSSAGPVPANDEAHAFDITDFLRTLYPFAFRVPVAGIGNDHAAPEQWYEGDQGA